MANLVTNVDNGVVPPVPVLRVVPLEAIRRHEEVDPFRVERLMGRISEEGVQVNPMVCVEATDGALVLLDGATRTEALRGLGLDCAVVQVVDPESVTLETWHHVVRQCQAAEVLSQIEAHPDLVLTHPAGPPTITVAGFPGARSVLGTGISPNATMSALVGSYIGRWTVSRIADPAPESVLWRFPDWSLVVEFPTMSVEDVMKAALGDDLLPAGVTRFLVPERALRLNADLSLLTAPGELGLKQEALDAMLQARSRAGRIRRYEETVIVLDD